METKEQRLVIVNQIIKEISSCGRRFFYSSKTDTVGELQIVNGRLFYKSEWSPSWEKSMVYMHTKGGYPPRNFSHGGTLWALLKDFKEFVMNGGDTNHNNGYGGLYCPHWGYDESDMEKIRAIAIDLGYLIKK